MIMPSPYSSSGTQGDARVLAENLGIACHELSIAEPMELYDRVLAPVFGDRAKDITEENLQARIRGNLLMAMSNKFGWLVLTTGNKSEMSVGYSTLYGDSAGGFAVIKDCPKLLVYRLVDVRARARRALADPGVDRHPRAVGRAAPRPEGRGLAAALRDPRRDPARLRRGGPRPRAAHRPRPARGRRRPRPAPRRPRRVQAPPAAARHQGHLQGLRPRPPRADHQPLSRLSATGAIPLQRPSGDRHPHSEQRRCSSSVISTSQTHVVRPRWRTRASAWMVPPRIGRRNEVWFERP